MSLIKEQSFPHGRWLPLLSPSFAEPFSLLPLKQNRDPCSYTFPGFGNVQTVPDALGKNGQIGVSFAYGTVDNTGLSNTWDWNPGYKPEGQCPDTQIGPFVFGKSCTDKVAINAGQL